MTGRRRAAVEGELVKAFGVLLTALACAASLSASAADQFDWGLPEGVAPPPVPADNPMSAVKVELGQRLFHEPALSRDFSMSCASCHQQHRAFSETQKTHAGVNGQAGKRNAQSLSNIGYFPILTWADPAATSLEAQARNPIFGKHPVEMGMDGMEAELVRRLSANACYKGLFAAAFPEERGAVTLGTVTKAIAAYERTLLSFNSPYDRARRGEPAAISQGARRGAAVFEAKGCASCHAGENFTDYAYHDIGLPPAKRDAGLVEKTGKRGDANRFRTPSLRNVGVSGPFMHDGSINTLTGSILAHAKGRDGGPFPAVSEEEAAELAQFLDTLTDPGFVKSAKTGLKPARCQ